MGEGGGCGISREEGGGEGMGVRLGTPTAFWGNFYFKSPRRLVCKEMARKEGWKISKNLFKKWLENRRLLLERDFSLILEKNGLSNVS